MGRKALHLRARNMFRPKPLESFDYLEDFIRVTKVTSKLDSLPDQASKPLISDQDATPRTPKTNRFSTVFEKGKSKRYSTRRSSAWKTVSRRITTFKGSGYMKFS